jgi:hypothetical protein
VTNLEHEKNLLEAKIETHRRIVGLEVRAARSAFDPIGIALSFLGADPRVVEILPPLLRAITASMGRDPEQAAEDSPDEPDGA